MPATAVVHRTRWWGFAPYAALSVIHVVALAVGSDAVAAPTKLGLMPLLVLAVVWGARGTGWSAPLTLLVVALGFSWLGDGAATFFPFLGDELPAMLLCFGVAHVLYIVLFWRMLAVRRLPWWSAVYAAWWVVLLIVLWPHLGALAIAVAAYGVVLGGTAVSATRCRPAITVGAVFFLASDTILAFRIFLPDAMPDWTSPAVMLTYTLGQGLIAAGVLLSTRTRRPA
jgi:uncharacterized membrane protein YhhN